MSDIDDKLKENNRKIIYLNNKLFEQRMEEYSEKICKSDFEYIEGRVRYIKDYQNKKNENVEVEEVGEVEEEKQVDRIKSIIDKNSKKSSINSEVAFKLKQLKIKIYKIIAILTVLYISPFIINALTDSGVNIFISLGIVIAFINFSIMFISTM